MKILVTGGAGFIGSHVVDVLMEQGHDVIIYDLEAPVYGQKCEHITGDVNDSAKLKSAVKGIDAVYHMAAQANVNVFFNEPVISNMNTSNTTINVLEAARESKTGRVLLSSTEWIYGSVEGDDDTQITEETIYAQNPDHLYTSSKIAAELFCKNYKNLYGVNYTILRYGIPFGERARAATVTPIFIDKILKGEEITIHGTGSQTRQFIYVRDLAEGNVSALKSEGENEIFNINGREVIKVIDIVTTLEEILGKKAKVKFIEDRKGNYKGRFISSEKAEQMLGWKPKYSYREAMEKYVKTIVQ
ncbi:MAG TPA: NAD-dependent epimerase/dehydratase family protein [Ignavibacteria bacterium]|nr:NAD-dependent epimerase/dehydratase family protein [Ignavibacteria bacterium]HRF66235.1 NAD-dependent epimerase/dehydratase family protein [Ignavibacteria bacterium]HRJ03819.1 NAD-dependent epimerase/dehydratase family protein [Ignavibacteria bacterium]HRJ86787.1 NAD-dependent epimerase/dehydratase family protein [Ignavibacteria bacterium]